jgi:hypothetical protein
MPSGVTFQGMWLPMHIMYPPVIRAVSTMPSTMARISAGSFRVRVDGPRG